MNYLKEVSYGYMSWTACCDDDCQTHLIDKVGSGYFPRGSGQTQSSSATLEREESGDYLDEDLVWVGPSEPSSEEEKHCHRSHSGNAENWTTRSALKAQEKQKEKEAIEAFACE